MKKVLIIGANGFIGKHLISKLIQLQYKVIAFDLQQGDLKGVDYIVGDIVTGNSFEKVPWEELDVVIHLAAAGVKAKSREWLPCSMVNVIGTQHLLYALEKLPNPPLLLATRTFYENHLSEGSPFAENPYVVTKNISSELIKLWAAQSDKRRVIIGTVFQAFGTGDSAGNVLSYAVSKLKAGEIATFGSGKIQRDWIYIDDLIGALVASFVNALEITNIFKDNNVLSYDYGTGELTSLRKILEKLVDISGLSQKLFVFDASRDRNDTEVEDRAVIKVPRWQPSLSLDQALVKIYNESSI